MTTALNLITGAARLIGVVRKSEALTADEAADGFVALNDMLASWSNNGLLCVSRVWEYFTVTSATSYTIGSGQSLNTTRPLVIRSAFFRSGDIDYPLEIISDEEYESITLKTLSSDFPRYLSYDNAYPYGTIRLYPQGAGQLHLLSEKPITNIAALSTTVDLPAGWNRAIRYNLAIDIAPEYGEAPSPAVVEMAKQSKSDIMLSIAKNRPIKAQRNNISYYDYYTGLYV
jgi:hypothetical protein